MAIVEVREDHNGRGCTDEVDGRGVVIRTYKRKFWARVDDPTTDPALSLAHITIPAKWAFYQSDTFFDGSARCIKRTPNQVSPYRIEVDVEYSTRWRDIADSVSNPLDMPYRISGSSRDYQRPCEKDFKSTPEDCVNSSGEPFDPPLISDSAAPVLRVVTNRAFFPPEWEEYLDPKATNDALFLGRNPGTVKVNSFNYGDPQTENGVTYVAITLEFFVKNTGWDIVPVDMGFMERVPPVVGDARPIIEAGGIPPKARLLDGFGSRLATGAAEVYLDGTDSKQGPFRTQPRRTFSIFGIT